MTEPRTASTLTLESWRQCRNTEPLLILRCSADGGECGKELGRVWAVSRGLLVHAYMHTAPERRAFSVSEPVPEHMVSEVEETLDGTFKRHGDDGVGILRGIPDSEGWAVMVEPAEHWSGIAVGCLSHSGQIELDRVALYDRAADALRLGKARVSVPANSVQKR